MSRRLFLARASASAVALVGSLALASASPAPAPGPPPAAEDAASKPPKATALHQLPADTKVLHIGDSFAGALGRGLNDVLKAHRVAGTLKFKKATYIPTWASGTELSTYLSSYKPDLVVITLGANELQVPDPQERVRTIKKLVSRLQGRPCIWVGVPLWPGARGDLLEVIRDNVAPCLYVDSNRLYPDMPRARDGIHPSIAAREEWARRVVEWLQRHVEPQAASLGEWRLLADPPEVSTEAAG